MIGGRSPRNGGMIVHLLLGKLGGRRCTNLLRVLREIIGMQFIRCNEASQFPTNQSRKLNMLRNFIIQTSECSNKLFNPPPPNKCSFLLPPDHTKFISMRLKGSRIPCHKYLLFIKCLHCFVCI